ncbi:MAG: Eco47II family restriction endonuclease [Paraclostridium sp.]
MSNKYLDFISDDKLMECIEFLYEKYTHVAESMDLKKFHKNKLDPIKFSFDMAFKGITEEQKILEEIYRQQDKSISNHIGKFHEKVIANIDGFSLVNNGLDIAKDDKTIFVEVKNKHNTIKGEDKKNVHKKLQDIADENPDAVCYVVHIIGKDSYNRTWEFTSGKGNKKKEYCDERVREITADKFYEIATGKKDAFYQLCKVIPLAIDDYIKLNNIEAGNMDKSYSDIYEKIKKQAEKNEITVINEIYRNTFEDDLGFKKKK